jgi:hypothetical protein
MSSDKINQVYKALKNCYPQTPNEIALSLSFNQKTVQSILLELANTRKDVRWRKIGHFRVFWREGNASVK